MTAIVGKKAAIDSELKVIIASLQLVEDHHTLDHVLSTLTQLSRSIQSHVREQNKEECSDFKIKHHFSPSQKNEKQLVFKRTTESAGRKRKDNIWQ